MHAMALFPSFLLFDALQTHYIIPIKQCGYRETTGYDSATGFSFPNPPPLHFHACFEGLFSSRQSYEPGGGGGGVLRISSDRDEHIKIPKIPRASNKTPKNPWTKI